MSLAALTYALIHSKSLLFVLHRKKRLKASLSFTTEEGAAPKSGQGGSAQLSKTQGTSRFEPVCAAGIRSENTKKSREWCETPRKQGGEWDTQALLLLSTRAVKNRWLGRKVSEETLQEPRAARGAPPQAGFGQMETPSAPLNIKLSISWNQSGLGGKGL